MGLHHATCVELAGIGVLLVGPSGCGKSDLALRLIDGGATLVADDQVALERRDGRLLARAPDRLAGLLEVRGLGILRLNCRDQAGVGLAVELVAAGAVERMRAPAARRFEGVAVPLVTLAPFEASACAKVRLAAQGAGQAVRTDKES
ncbi:MAG: serine/threonine protein kinase [Alphaproteobacteria bacterium]|nr:serine/threonine protein kinase [Alphaproteobacteria bacterium]